MACLAAIVIFWFPTLCKQGAISFDLEYQKFLTSKTAQTGFSPHLYSSGSSLAGCTLVEVATARSFVLNRGILTDIHVMPAMLLEPGHVQCISLHQYCCQPGWCPEDGLTELCGLTVKVQCLSTCLPPRQPNSLWLSYRPRVVGIDALVQPKQLYLYSQSAQACKPICRAPTWLTTALMEWNALHSIMAIMSAPVEYKRPCSYHFLPEQGLHHYKMRVGTSPACLQGKNGALSWGGDLRTYSGIIAPPTGTPFHSII